MTPLTTETFDAGITNDLPVIVVFATPTSVKAKKIISQLGKIEKEGKIVAFSVDADECLELTLRFSIRRIPYLLRFEGGEVVAASHLIDAVL